MKDWEGVRLVVRGRTQPIILAVLENRRVAISDKNARCDILGQQRLPAHLRCGMFERFGEDVRDASSEIMRQRTKEGREILLRGGGDKVASGPAVSVHIDAETVALRLRVDRKVHGRGD